MVSIRWADVGLSVSALALALAAVSAAESAGEAAVDGRLAPLDSAHQAKMGVSYAPFVLRADTCKRLVHLAETLDVWNENPDSIDGHNQMQIDVRAPPRPAPHPAGRGAPPRPPRVHLNSPPLCSARALGLIARGARR